MIFTVLIGALLALSSLVIILSGLVNESIFQHLGSKRTYLAWIPIVSYYELAMLTRDENNQNKFFKFNIDNKWFKYWYVAMSAATIIPWIGGILGIVLQIGCLGTCYARAFAVIENKQISEVTKSGYLCGFLPIIVIFKYKHLLNDTTVSKYTNAQYDVMQPQYNNMQQGYNQGYNAQMQQGYNGFNNQQPQQGYNQYGQGVTPPQQMNMQFDQPMQQGTNVADEFNGDMF